MKINVARSAGFCFGVKRAINIALENARSTPGLEMLGDIVHNEEVVAQVAKAGIRKISSLRRRGDGKTLLIRAHGASQATVSRAKALGYRIIDATCPMVQEIHRTVTRLEGQGYRIIVIGDKKHDEVIGIVGQLKHKAVVIDSKEAFKPAQIRKLGKTAVVVQSTQNLEKVERIVEQLRPLVKELAFFNTICKPTRTKQEELKTMPRENDCMIIIGSKTSANTRRLYELSRSLNKRTHWIQTKKELRPAWFKGCGSVGISAGASTPEDTTREVIAAIAALGK
jgi:4-hydroxy-3-methylbut-2-en-1-yl diphosphate reductase